MSIQCIEWILMHLFVYIDFDGKDLFKWESNIDPYYSKYRGIIHSSSSPSPYLSRRNSNSSIYYDTIEHLTRPPSSFSLYSTPISSLTPVASHANLASVAKAYSNLSLQSKIGNGMPPRLRTTIKTLGDLFVTPTTTTSSNTQQPTNDLIGGVPSWVLSEKLSAIQQTQHETSLSVPSTTTANTANTASSTNDDFTNNYNNYNHKKSWTLRLFLKMENTVRYFTLRILKKMMKYRGTLYWIVACILLRNGVQELIEHVFMLMMQVLLNSNSARNTVGLRSILSLTTGQMTL
jgi:hypothetical protein